MGNALYLIFKFITLSTKRWAVSFFVSLSAVTLLFFASPAQADKIENEIAVFAALDKVTARISHLEIKLGETVKFGALTLTPRVCYTRPPTEPPQTSVFVEIDEKKLNKKEERIFTGWMFAQNPGVHAVEHPVFDVWLTNCKTESGDTLADSPRKSERRRRAFSRRR